MNRSRPEAADYNIAPPTRTRRIADSLASWGYPALLLPGIASAWFVTWLLADYANWCPMVIAGTCAAAFTVGAIYSVLIARK